MLSPSVWAVLPVQVAKPNSPLLPVAAPPHGLTLLPPPPESKQNAPPPKPPSIVNGSRPLPAPRRFTSAVATLLVDRVEKPRMPLNNVEKVCRGIRTRICWKFEPKEMQGDDDAMGSDVPVQAGSDDQFTVWLGRFCPARFCASVTAGAVVPASRVRSWA